MLVLVLGLGGCASNLASTTHKAESAKSAKIVKQDNKKSTTVQSSTPSVKENQGDSQTTSNNKVSCTSSSEIKDTTNGSSDEQQNDISKAPTAQATSKVAASSSSQSQRATRHQVQLDLGDVASWTDRQGVTHHVDSDGMDRYTSNGSQEVHYQDWSGSLPQDATVSHNN